MVWSKGPTSLFYMCIHSSLNTVCWKGCFSPLNGLGILVEKQLTIDVKVYFWTLKFILLISVSILSPIPHCFHFFSFVVSCELGSRDSSLLFFFFPKIDLAVWHLLKFHMNLRISFSISVIKAIGILIGTESVAHFGEYCHLNNIRSSDQWTWGVFPLIKSSLINLNNVDPPEGRKQKQELQFCSLWNENHIHRNKDKIKRQRATYQMKEQDKFPE